MRGFWKVAVVVSMGSLVACAASTDAEEVEEQPGTSTKSDSTSPVVPVGTYVDVDGLDESDIEYITLREDHTYTFKDPRVKCVPGSEESFNCGVFEGTYKLTKYKSSRYIRALDKDGELVDRWEYHWTNGILELRNDDSERWQALAVAPATTSIALNSEEAANMRALFDRARVPVERINADCTEGSAVIQERVRGFNPAKWSIEIGERSETLTDNEIQAAIRIFDRVKVPGTHPTPIDSVHSATIKERVCNLSPARWSIEFEEADASTSTPLLQ